MAKPRGEMSEEELLAERRRDLYRRMRRHQGKPSRVLPEECEQARRKVVAFHDRGMGFREMEAECGGKPSRHAFGNLASGQRKTLLRSSYEAIMAMRFVPPEGGGLRHGPFLASIGAARRIYALRALGFTASFLAEYAGYSADRPMTWGEGRYIHPALRNRICEMYDKLRDRKPEEFGIEGPLLARMLTLARNAGFAPPGCWDEDTIDDPAAVPEWTGYCGTPEGYITHLLAGLTVCPACADAVRVEGKRKLPSLGVVAAPFQLDTDAFARTLARRGLSARQVDLHLAVANGTASKWLSGAYSPRLYTGYKLADYLDIPWTDLYRRVTS